MTKQQLPSFTKQTEKSASETPGKPVGLPQDVNGDDVFEEDFSDVKDTEFPMAEVGLHHAKVVDFEKSESRTHNPQYVWQLRITAGNSKDIEIRFWSSLLPQARWKTAETLAAIGIPAAGSIAKFRRSDIVGKPCIIEVIHDVYEGRLNHKVVRVHPPDDNTHKFLEQSDTPF